MREPSAPGGATAHYQLRDGGYYIVWGADFPGDHSGERKLLDKEITKQIKLMAIDTRKNRYAV